MVTHPDVTDTWTIIFTERYTKTVTRVHVGMQTINKTTDMQNFQRNSYCLHIQTLQPRHHFTNKRVALQAAYPQLHAWTRDITCPVHGCRETHLAVQCDIQRQMSSGKMEPDWWLRFQEFCKPIVKLSHHLKN